MRLGGKTLSAYVGHPDLQRPQAPLPHPSSVLSDPFPHGHAVMLHVTRDFGSRMAQVDDPALATWTTAGDRWTLLILREVYFGVHRFNDIRRNLAIARTPQ